METKTGNNWKQKPNTLLSRESHHFWEIIFKLANIFNCTKHLNLEFLFIYLFLFIYRETNIDRYFFPCKIAILLQG